MPLDDDLDFAPNPRAAVGDNLPKAAQSIEAARETYASIAAFLKSAVVIQDEETAKQAKLFLDRGLGAVADLEKDLDAEATPLRKIWMDCRAKFTPAIESFTKPLIELRQRMTVYALAEEAKRKAVLDAARLEAEKLRLAAMEAERMERETKDNASVGDLEADVGAAIQEADEKFAAFKAADNAAARAYRDAEDTTIRGGFARGVGLKTKKSLVVADHAAAMLALAALPLTDGIRDEIIKAARAYQKLNKALPPGVTEETERKI
jgi:hypothetical protein